MNEFLTFRRLYANVRVYYSLYGGPDKDHQLDHEQKENTGNISKNKNWTRVQCFLCFSSRVTFLEESCINGSVVECHGNAAEGQSLQIKTFVFSYIYLLRSFINIL